MPLQTDTLIALALLLAAGGYLALRHWRFHPQATHLESLADLKRRLGQGKPVLVQFHAPL